MKCKIVRKIEDIIEAEGDAEGDVERIGKTLNIEGIKIKKRAYDLKLTNFPVAGRFNLDFNDGDYVLLIEEKGIRFQRTLYRPKHDHNDRQDLYINNKTGKLRWDKDSLDDEEIFYIKFGPKTADY